jgi:hypothetical protein
MASRGLIVATPNQSRLGAETSQYPIEIKARPFALVPAESAGAFWREFATGMRRLQAEPPRNPRSHDTPPLNSQGSARGVS